MNLSGHSGSNGFLISAQDASIELINTTITDNKGQRDQQPQKKLAAARCSNSTTTSSSSQDGTLVPLPACFAPQPPSSLISMRQSSMVLRSSHLTQNSAGVLIAAAGAAPHQIVITSGSTIRSNDAEWVMMADSWQYDQVARRLVNVGPMVFPNATTSIEKLQQPDQGFLNQTMSRTAYDVWQHVPSSISDLNNTSSKLARSIAPLLEKIPRGVKPLGVVLEEVEVAGNIVEGGLMWLRLVNITLSKSTVHNNTAGMQISKSSSSSSRGAGYLVARKLEGVGSACDPPVFDAFIRVVGPMPFMMSRYVPCSVIGGCMWCKL